MLHPLYDLEHYAGIRSAIESLRLSPYIMDKVGHHDPSFGYNDLEDFVEEDCVQALEQTITQSLGLKNNEQDYWRQQDGGMHVLAVAL